MPFDVDSDAIEIIHKRLYWLSRAEAEVSALRDTDEVHYFNIDNTLAYEPFLHDFGPVDIAMTYWYVRQLNMKLRMKPLAAKKLVHCCSDCECKRANAAYLMCAFLVIILRMPAEEAVRVFDKKGVAFKPFRDASRGMSSFQLTILDCLRGLEAGMRLRWFDMQSFNLQDYVHYQEVTNGDMNWIVPNKFLAFAGPKDASLVGADEPICTPSDLIPVFQSKGIQAVVRLNSSQYNAEDFTSEGFLHADMIFPDGSCPSQAIITRFLNFAETVDGAVAVHCKAGLGRTGTLIGLYVMKHYDMTAMEFIAWSRLCRPGSVLGPQQQFLCDMEPKMFHFGGASADSAAETEGDRIEAARTYTDDGQGERLVNARRSSGSSGETPPLDTRLVEGHVYRWQ